MRAQSVMELMSFDNSVKVEQPQELIDYMKKQHREALAMYE
ncbi:MAG: hypothetical protein WCJ03_01600 [Bacteroidales bacterium]